MIRQPGHRRYVSLFGLVVMLTGIVLVGEKSGAQPVPTGGLLTTVAPTRVLDTRGGSKLGAGQTRRLTISGIAGVPIGASAVSINLTAVNPTAATYLTVWPAGGLFPETSNLNVESGAIRPNAAIVGLSEDGSIDIFNAFGNVDVLVDLTGWFSSGPLAAGGLQPINPVRVADSRRPLIPGGLAYPLGEYGKLADGPPLVAKVTGVGGVPETGVAAVVLNVTATAPSMATFFTVQPNGGSGLLNVSSLNVRAGETAANLVIVPIIFGGSIVVHNAFGKAHAIVDVMGWISSGTPGPGGFVPVAPTRMYDSRGGTGIRPRGWLPIKLGGSVIPPSGVAAVAANVTAVDPDADSFVSTFPTAAGFSTRSNIPVPVRPNSSTVNARKNTNVPNAAIIKVGPESSFWTYNQDGFADLLVDVSGYWIGLTPTGNAPEKAAAGPSAGGYTQNTFSNGMLNFWDTCGPITIRVDPTDGATRGLDEVAAIIDRVRRSTGLPLVYGGTTSSTESLSQVPNREVVIRWRSSLQDTGLAGSTIAIARWNGSSNGEVRAALVTARTDSFAFNSGFGPGGTWGAILLHELGHVFGLAHTSDTDQLMYPSIQRGLGEYGGGDLTGLSLVRRDGCFLKQDGEMFEMVVAD